MKYPDPDCQNYMKSPQSGLGYDPETLKKINEIKLNFKLSSTKF